MQTNKVFSYVGFAVRAGKVKIGIDNVLSAKKVPYVVLYDKTLAENSKKKLLSRCENVNPTFCVDMDDVFPGKGCKVLGITDRNLAKAIIDNLEENS